MALTVDTLEDCDATISAQLPGSILILEAHAVCSK